MPKSVKDRELLEEDLRRIGCHGFLGKPWGLRMEEMVAELIGEKDNRWDGTVRQAPKKWTAKEWRKVYNFGRGGEGMASRTDRFIDGMFCGKVNPKDGYAVADCRDPRVRRVLEFLVPLLYPEKPTRVTITVGNTIFGALSGERPVDWGIVVKDLVQRLLSGMGKSKATPSALMCFIFTTPTSFYTQPAWSTRMRGMAWMTRSAKASPLVRSEKFRSRRRPGSRNHRSIGGNNRQHQRIRSPASGRAHHQGMQWMQWSETTRPLRLLAGRSGQESVNGKP